MNLNGTEYFYVKNGQGDIIAIIDKTGAEVVQYSYDTWGKILSVTGTLASTVGQKNPYRYRGYRYDSETGLYYLQSRYYNPTWGRFINADGLIGQPGQLIGHNMFAYCVNNPVILYDPDGDFAFLIPVIVTAPEWVPVVAGVTTAVVGGIVVGTELSNRVKDKREEAAEKAAEKEKTNTKKKKDTPRIYFMAAATYPGAKVYLFQPLNIESARMRLEMGYDVYVSSLDDANELCNLLGGSSGLPTNDGNPKNAAHIHSVKYVDRAHVFLGEANIEFKQKV